MIYRIIVLLFVSLVPIGHVYGETYYREYIYHPENSDDIETSRAIASDEIKKALLSELGTFIQHELTIKRSQSVSTAFEDTEIITSGFVSLEILEEKWINDFYYMRAKLEVDPIEIKENLRVINKNKKLVKQIKSLKLIDTELRNKINNSQKELNDKKNINRQHSTYLTVLATYKEAISDLETNNLIIQGLIEQNVRSNQIKACKNFIKARNSGSKFPALFGLVGSCYQNGWVVEKNPEKALELFRQGVTGEMFDEVSALQLIRLKISGDSLPDNLDMTLEFALEQAEITYKAVPESSRLFFYSIIKGDHSFDIFNLWAERYAKKNKVDCFLGKQIADAFQLGVFRNRIKLPISLKDSIKWNVRVADECKGNGASAFKSLASLQLYSIYLYNDGYKDENKAVKYLEVSAENGSHRALFLLAILKKLGVYVDRDYQKAAELFQQARDMFSKQIANWERNQALMPDSHHLVEYKVLEGYMYYRGIGVPVDTLRAKSIWEQVEHRLSECDFFRPVCFWVEVALSELRNTPKNEVMVAYKIYADRGEPNSIYDYNRLKNGFR